MRYLDPKADLTFKKVFGEHPDLVMSFLNALLPLEKDEEIQSIEYLSPEMVPDNPARKYSIVDVRCKDVKGRQFLVEMQTIWSSEFKQRVLFNASKAYVRQLNATENYNLLQPVYSLNLVSQVFEPDVETYYHYYRLVHEQHSNKVINGLHLVFVELPKFKPRTYSEKKMQVLWLRFLSEIDGNTREVDEELLSNTEIKKALDIVEQSAFTDAQLDAYDKFWDGVRVENAIINDAEEKGEKIGIAKGEKIGIEKGIEIGRAEEAKNKTFEFAREMKEKGFDNPTITEMTGLTEQEINDL